MTRDDPRSRKPDAEENEMTALSTTMTERQTAATEPRSRDPLDQALAAR
jgi:hypothetical protein